MKMNRQPGPAYCLDCIHHQLDVSAIGSAANRCGVLQAASLVDGAPSLCTEVRDDERRCGSAGTWFRARPLDREMDIFSSEPAPNAAPRSIASRVRQWFR